MRNVSVLASSCTKESGKKLAKALGVEYHDTKDLANTLVGVRWGNARGDKFKFELNKRDAIDLNVQKHKALEVMEEVVRTPRRFMRTVPEGQKVVVRTFEHQEGIGFRVQEGPFRLEPGEFAAEFIETDTERRVWWVGNHFRAADRVKRQNDPAGPCRSRWGYEVCEVTENMKKFVKKAADAVGLDFGAADILWDPAKGNYVMLELNSAPALDTPQLLEFFKAHIEEMLVERFPDVVNFVERRNGRDRRQA